MSDITNQAYPISRLLYSSTVSADVDLDDINAEVEQIAAKAVARNDRVGITGSLLFIENSFIQILEGPSGKVEEIFEAICRDFRHEDIKLIDYNSADRRLFPEWGMAFLSSHSNGKQPSVKLRDELKEIKFMAGVNAREAMAQMRSVVVANAKS